MGFIRRYLTGAKGISILLAVFLLVLIVLMNLGAPEEVEVTPEQYRELLEKRNIVQATITGSRFHGKLRIPIKMQDDDQSMPHERIVVDVGFVDGAMESEWERYGVEYKFRRERGWMTQLGVTIASWIVLLGFFAFGIWHIMERARRGKEIGNDPEVWQLERMREQGMLTDEEFEERRKEIVEGGEEEEEEE